MTLNFGDGTSGSVTLGAGGTASTSHSYTNAGSYTVNATYNGSAIYATSIGATFTPVVVTASPTFTTVTVSPNPVPLGQSVTATATVVGTLPVTGTATFNFGDGFATTATVSNGVATATHAYATTGVGGSFPIIATFNANSNFLTSSNVVTANVSKAASTTALIATPNPSSVGQSVSFTATVTGSPGTPTGSVTVNLGDGTFQTVALAGGTATLTHAYPIRGTFNVTAVYTGDNNFTVSSGGVQQSVGATTTTVSSAPNPSLVGQSVAVTATVTAPSGTPTGTVTFNLGDGVTTTATLTAGGTAIVNHVYASSGTFTIAASYGGDANNSTSSGTTLQNVNLNNSSTTVTSSRNPSEVGQSVTFTATATSGAGTPTGSVTFKDGSAVLGTATLASGVASFTTSALTQGSHSITVIYAGSSSFATSTSAPLIQVVSIPADSIKLRAMQQLATPVVAQVSGQAISGAVDSAIREGFGSGGAFVTSTATGIRFNFAADPENPANSAVATADPFNGRGPFSSPVRNPAGGPVRGDTGSSGRVDDAFAALAYAAPTKAPPRYIEQRDWLGWAEVRGATLDRWTTGALGVPTTQPMLYGNQVNVLGGVTRRLTPNFLVGVLGGYETFDYRSDALQGRLTGDGWTVGTYLGWRLAPNLRFDASAAYSGIGYSGSAGTASGSFGGQRVYLASGLTGTYESRGFLIEPSARLYALWEHENSYVDTLGTQQASLDLSTGRASGGVKVAYPIAWLSNAAEISPYLGLYGDYYFNGTTGAALPGAVIPPVFVLDGWSARATGGVTARFANGGQVSIGGERSGIGGNFALWTYRARASLPFSAQ